MSAPQPGFFELYPAVRPVLDAGAYTLTGQQSLLAATQHDGNVPVPVDGAEFHLDVVSPRYALPPDQILSTYPPATTEGDWSDRLPQIVLKRRTLPWERNPGGGDPASAPPWLALVVIADGEGQVGADTDVAQCVGPGVVLPHPEDADVARGSFLQVRQSVVNAVFPTRDELDLLCHVRRVDLSDTELAEGDDDGWLAVVIANRLPQPAPPAPGSSDPGKQKYTACLINLEGQLDALLAAEPTPADTFDRTLATELVDPRYLQLAPADKTVDVLAMGLGPSMQVEAPQAEATPAVLPTDAPQGVPQDAPPRVVVESAPFGVGRGVEQAGLAWSTGPARQRANSSDDLAVATAYRTGVTAGLVAFEDATVRFPVLVSWSFTCTGAGGFERLMTDLDVGLLGTVDADPPSGRARGGRHRPCRAGAPHPAGRPGHLLVPRAVQPTTHRAHRRAGRRPAARARRGPAAPGRPRRGGRTSRSRRCSRSAGC